MIPDLEILILTMPTRKDFLLRLLANIEPQIVPQVEIFVRMCDPALTLGDNREIMRQSSHGRYIVQIDDDDRISETYVQTILPLLDGVDQIGYQVQCYFDGVPFSRTYHSIAYYGWYEQDGVYMRDISHINPMRRDLALSEPMEGGHGEDYRWAERMRGKVKTEHYIPKIMYHYLFRSKKERSFPCPKCNSLMTVRLETDSACNACGNKFQPVDKRLSCLWD